MNFHTGTEICQVEDGDETCKFEREPSNGAGPAVQQEEQSKAVRSAIWVAEEAAIGIAEEAPLVGNHHQKVSAARAARQGTAGDDGCNIVHSCFRLISFA